MTDNLFAALAVVIVMGLIWWAVTRAIKHALDHISDLCAWNYENGRADGYNQAMKDARNDNS